MIASLVRRAAASPAHREALPLRLIKAAQPHIPQYGFTLAAVRAGIQSPSSSTLAIDESQRTALNDWNIGRLFPGSNSAETSLPLQLLRRWDAEQMGRVAKEWHNGKADGEEAAEVLVERLKASEAVRHHLLEPFSYLSASSFPIPLRAILPLPLALALPLPSSIPNPLPLVNRAAQIADEACSLARVDTSFGPEWYARRMRLAAAFFAAEVHLLAPSSDLAASTNVLRRVAGNGSLLGAFDGAARSSSTSSVRPASRPWPTATQPGLARQLHTTTRPRMPLHPSAERSRHYATGPSQASVVSTFASPFLQFVRTLSAIARILVGTALTFALLCGGLYEGAHQYVEHVAMKRGSRSNDVGDAWGWSSEADEEAWGRGTDRRLGMAGRHALRSAWISLHWGTGIAPDFLFGGGSDLFGPSSWRKSATPSLDAIAYSQNALEQAERYLEVAIRLAEKQGVKLPDVAAVRLGLTNAHQAGTDKPLDETALRMESRLAATRERVGSPAAVGRAITGYERIFDALSAAELTRETTGHSGREGADASRLVRLATKLGDLNALLGKREEAEAWMLKAVSLAGQGPQPTVEGAQREEVLGQVAHMNGEQGERPQVSSSWFSGWTGSKKAQDAAAAPATTLATPTPTPTPALTRSLVTSLLSLSALYASSPNPASTTSAPSSDPAWRTGLEEAVRVQAAALRLIRLDLEREQSSASKEAAGELHTLWLQHREALTSSHLAETMYALQSRSGAAGVLSKVRGALTGLFHSTHEEDHPHASSIQWLRSADSLASSVQSSLARPSPLAAVLSGRSSPAAKKAAKAASVAGGSTTSTSSPFAPEDVQERWLRVEGGDMVAWRLLRDSTRLRAEAGRMVKALGGRLEVEKKKEEVRKAALVETEAKPVEQRTESEAAPAITRRGGRGPFAPKGQMAV